MTTELDFFTNALQLDMALAERLPVATEQLAQVAKAWVSEETETRIYKSALSGPGIERSALAPLKEGVDILKSQIAVRSQESVKKFLTVDPNNQTNVSFLFYLAGLSCTDGLKELDRAFTAAFDTVVYPLGKSLRQAKLLGPEELVDAEDPLTGLPSQNTLWIRNSRAPVRLAIQDELSNGMLRLMALRHQANSVESVKMADYWLETWRSITPHGRPR